MVARPAEAQRPLRRPAPDPLGSGAWPGLGPREARALFEAVTGHRIRRFRFFDEALAPAMSTWSGFADEYARYRRFASAPPFARGGDGPWADLWTFYALSRVFEWLIIGVQDRAKLGRRYLNWPNDGTHPVPTRDELVRFFETFGMTPVVLHPRYHPFFHEVAAAERDPALGRAIVVEEEVWPGVWFGDLLFARSGVRVRCGPDAPLDPAFAVRSTLYFAWTRVHRPVRDLSHGWGSNSQWATSFRRDYVDGAVLRYNVDGRVRLTGDAAVPQSGDRDLGSGYGLTPAERVALLKHRCLVSTGKPSEEFWPFGDTCTEPAPGPDWTW